MTSLFNKSSRVVPRVAANNFNTGKPGLRPHKMLCMDFVLTPHWAASHLRVHPRFSISSKAREGSHRVRVFIGT